MKYNLLLNKKDYLMTRYTYMTYACVATILLLAGSFNYSNTMAPAVEAIVEMGPEIIAGAVAAGAIIAEALVPETRAPVMPMPPMMEQTRQDSNGQSETPQDMIRDAVIGGYNGYLEEVNRRQGSGCNPF